MNLSIDKGFKLLQHLLERAISTFTGLIELFYPRICAGCDAHLMKHEENLCLLCVQDLPRTYFWDYDVNPVEKLFWGKIPVHAACSFLHFEQDGVVQHLMHRLKYEGHTAIGTELGKRFGMILLEKQWFHDADIVVPVPLHVSKELRRGYNQSSFIADGLGDVLSLKVNLNLLERTEASESQTKKSRFARTENVRSVFRVTAPEIVRGKNILLVDDVVTTGATLEAAGAQLVGAGANKIYMATVAVA